MHSIILRNGQVLTTKGFRKSDLLIEEGKIKYIAPTLIKDGIETVDVEGKYILPGFIDIHTHGAIGIDMNDCHEESLKKVSAFFASCGTTTFLPTILTDSKEKLIECIQKLVKGSKRLENGAKVYGIHMEGPYLCKDYKGAMPEAYLQLPKLEDFEVYQKEANGMIKIITVSPEVEGVPEFIEEVSATGVRVSMGHSGADYETTMTCIKKGAKGATHTFNVMKLMHQHFPAISGAVLESDIYCEAICDGRHLHPAIVRLLIKTKGEDRVIAVTDSIMAAGLGDGHYKLGANEIVVREGDAKLTDLKTRAGSTLTLNQALINLKAFTNKPLETLSKLLSKNPADYLGIGNYKGQIEVGYDADLVVLEEDLTVSMTLVEGKRVYTKKTR